MATASPDRSDCSSKALTQKKSVSRGIDPIRAKAERKYSRLEQTPDRPNEGVEISTLSDLLYLRLWMKIPRRSDEDMKLTLLTLAASNNQTEWRDEVKELFCILPWGLEPQGMLGNVVL